MDVDHKSHSGSSNKSSKRLSQQFLHVIQHSPRDSVGRAAELPFTLKVHRSDLDSNIPRLGDAVGLILMGGPQTAFSDEGFPSRQGELRLIDEALEAGVPILGICLGAQLLATAAGGSVYRREEPEDGWYPVTLTPEGRHDPLFEGCPAVFSPRSHHRDSFELPPGAIRLGSSDRCVEQIFRIGEHAWGTQFHLETMPGHGRSADHEYTAKEIAKIEHSIARLEPTARQILRNFACVVESFTTTKSSRRLASTSAPAVGA